MGILLRFRQDDRPLFLTFSIMLGSFLYNALVVLSFKDKSMLSNEYAVCQLMFELAHFLGQIHAL